MDEIRATGSPNERTCKSYPGKDLQDINTIIDEFTSKLKEIRAELRRKLLLRRRIAPLTLAYLPEMTSTFQAIRLCANNGLISTCYREMRKIIESLTWVILDDILLFRKTESIPEDFPPFLRIPNKRWYDWAKSNNLILRGISQLTKPLNKKVINVIKKEYGWEKRKIEHTVFNNMTYPLLSILIGADKQPPKNLRDLIPHYETSNLLPYIKTSLTDIITQLKGKSLLNQDTKLIETIANLLANKPVITIPYPSPTFTMQMLEKLTKLKITKPYGEYSYFIHSYDKAWQLYPFSSVLEFKILKHQLKTFTRLLTQLLDFHRKEIKY